MLNSGIPEGTSASATLPEDAWDLLGLGATDGMNDRELHIKNGQVPMGRNISRTTTKMYSLIRVYIYIYTHNSIL